MQKEVVITGLGFVTSIGNSIDAVESSLREQKSGIERYAPFVDNNEPVSVMGTIKGFDLSSPEQEDWTYPERFWLSRSMLRGMSPHSLYSISAVEDALIDAGLDKKETSNPRTGLYGASGGSTSMMHYNLTRLKKLGVDRVNPKGIVSSVAGTLTFNLVSYFKIQGFSSGFVSACASSGHAIGFAWDAIYNGHQDRMIVVGAEDGDVDCILPFAGMRALSVNPDPTKASRPFDKDRDGFVGTGGATALILEERSIAEARGAKIYGRFLGWGQSSDGYNPVLPLPDGSGLARSMTSALEQANVQPSNVGYLNAHAPSTPFGDAAEIKGIKSIFEEGARPKVSSTKALTGHGLSLASAMEAAFTVLALDRGFLPGSANIENLDPMTDGVPILRQSEETSCDFAMSTSSGFGGANVSLVFGREA
ncbi:MAG: beta-ketoacyl-[acyl-carrier-protein] synthase family protein [Opitutales bacterium]|nr:beta-ketoacyl-[acyl-carrier-protein] synthase family protein [Opitutales bacterium]NRA27855.1 beta-ketoacyl-[acyl-carrier-protein] synthase family protein [Opitutales bacterium]